MTHYLPIGLCCALVTCVSSVFAASIKGTITDSEDIGLPGVTIQLQNTNLGAITDASGSYEIRSIPAGTYSVIISSIGFTRVTRRITLSDSQALELNLSLAESTEELGEVVITTQSESQLKKAAPIQIESIRLTDEVTSQIKDLSGALITLPGVRVQSSGSLGDRADIWLNGLSGQSVRAYLDGLPFEFLYPSLSITNLPVNSIRRIDVYKGIVPVDVGTDALAGAVNVVTNDRIGNFINAFYSYGSFNTHLSGLNSSIKLKSNLSLQLNSAYTYSDNNYKIKAEVPIAFDDFGNPDLAERTVRRFNDSYELKFVESNLVLNDSKYADYLKIGFGYSDYSKEVNNSVRIAENTAWGEYQYEGEVFAVNFLHEKALSDRLSIKNRFAYSYASLTTIDTTRNTYWWDGTIRFTDSSPGENGGIPTLADRNNNNIANRTTVKINVFDEDEILISNILAFQDIFGRDQTEDRAEDLLLMTQNITKNVSGVEYTKKLSKIIINAAGKLYYYNLNGVNNARNPVGISDFEHGFYGAVKYSYQPNLSVRGSFEKGIRIPNLGEYFGDGTVINPNAGLLPERSDNLNLEVSYKAPDKSEIQFGLEANLFYRDTKDLINLEASETNARYTNQSDVETLGFEMEAYIHFLKYFKFSNNVTKLRQDITGVGGVTQNQSLIGTPNPNTPKFIVFNQVEFGKADIINQEDRLRVYAQYYYVDTFNHILTGGIFREDNWVPVQHRANLGFTYSIMNNKWAFSGNVFNLLDEELFDNFAVPRPSRNYNIRVAYNLNNF